MSEYEETESVKKLIKERLIFCATQRYALTFFLQDLDELKHSCRMQIYNKQVTASCCDFVLHQFAKMRF